VYVRVCLSKNNKRIGVAKRKKKKIEVASKLQCRQGQELDTYGEGELNTQTKREREGKKAKSNLNHSLLLFYCTIY
jgi:hypothetical protein